ncbi:hypothetical protein PHYBOEH_011543 [Phytophthora boehmeriae]|uniref:C2 domain-containing protein n=1 Tax=Phytophthora boehmeriae TaxID=109152 RepID=A0A8T1VIY0_9STRA|nr:hypothetical protein PHYBOEH_011543 [Phytophthora boehmeriae]
MDGKKVAWTRPIFDTLEPVWNDTFFFKNVRLGAMCKLKLFDKDMDEDDPLGEAQFPISNTSGNQATYQLPITQEGNNQGTITVKMTSATDDDAEDDAVLQQYGPVRYSVHSSLTTGLMTGYVSNEDNLESLAYQVQLQNVPQFLPTDHEWNKSYETIQRIFSPDYPEAPILRAAIMAQHVMVYKHNSYTVYGAMKSPVDFFKLVHDGRRQDKQVLFTYVITKSGWYFSETGAEFFKDMMSKHMMHCGAAFSVLFAGEFRIDMDEFGEPKLIIDNDSGTYAPPKEDLPALKALFESNFPGLVVEAVDRDAEGQQDSRKQILDSWLE